MGLSDLTVTGFVQEVASNSPAPGGGSVAALAGAIAAGLTAMVSGLTIGRKKYAEVQETVLVAKAQAEQLQQALLDVMNRDTDAFLTVSAAYGMPKATEAEQAARSAAIEQALKVCTQTPFEMMELCDRSAALLYSLLGKTNATAASDFGVAALSLQTALQGAWLNVLINTASIRDTAFSAEYRERGEAILKHALPLTEQCYKAMLKACEN